MKATLFLAKTALATSISFAALAGTDFGTDEQARDVARQLSAIIQDGGVDAGIAAMHDPALPFASSVLGIHIFQETIIVADNREPELIAASYAEVQDLTEEAMWPRIVAAANTKSDAILKWYHYDTEAVYDYHCYSEWADGSEVLVMVCR